MLAVLAIYGHKYVDDFRLGRDRFPPLSPGTVDIIGLDTRAGYGVIVENRVAKLVFAGQDAFGPGKMDESSLQNSGGDRKFVPIKDMLKGLRGDVAGLSYFVERLNDIKDEEGYPDAPVWKIEDIERALSGDKALQDKLVHDINVNLDGSPVDYVTKGAVYGAILIDSPVPLEVTDGDRRVKVVARIKRSFKSKLMTTVEQSLGGKVDVSKNDITSHYTIAAKAIMSGTAPKEAVASRLRGYGKGLEALAAVPQKILDSITTVINEDQLTTAHYTTQKTNKGTSYTLVIGLTNEGAKRLYQFSRDRIGDQLLVTVNGVAIAAPFVDYALSSGEVQVDRLEDQSLVEDAVATINLKGSRTTK